MANRKMKIQIRTSGNGDQLPFLSMSLTSINFRCRGSSSMGRTEGARVRILKGQIAKAMAWKEKYNEIKIKEGLLGYGSSDSSSDDDMAIDGSNTACDYIG
ncbi:hypothetical protein HZH68_008605 [Vespula germanica]|uniref:Uncharacterized protein n=1 Tax=Vespula germanica TaxID=30212 RepID=A0A834N7M9_VESGE|nr:hypothetical protein HZH68_008605 [Vespula germanica]